MKKTVLSILLVFVVFNFNGQLLRAQSANDSILLIIENEKFSKNELIATFLKGYPNTNGKIDKKEFEEYLELFINYKLKVKQAKDLKMDTIPSYQEEYNRYRKQIVSPHQLDYDLLSKMIKQSYERMHTYKRASHILFKTKQGAPPADTLAAYKKALAAHKRLLKGENFDSLAVKISEDASARTNTDSATGRMQIGNCGDLGYFTTLEMVYPMEEVVYGLEVGKYSQPIRSIYGYHIIKPTASLKSQAKYQLQHIWTAGSLPADSAIGRQKIVEAYNELQKGRSFDEVAELFSLERNAAVTKGRMPSLLPNQVIPEYFEQATQLLINEYSKPFKSIYGWHIIKLIEATPIPEFDEVKDAIKNKILQGDRGEVIADSFDKHIKGLYQFQENKNTKKGLLTVQKMFTDSLFAGTWNYSQHADLLQTLFNFRGVNYTAKQFADFIKEKQRKAEPLDFAYYLNRSYNAYIHELCMNLVDQNIEQEDEETHQILQNYREGLLIFDINDKMVWAKAVADTAGLKGFYEKNSPSHLWNPLNVEENYYMWEERADITTWTIDSNCIEYKKATEIIAKGTAVKLADADIFENLKKKANKKCNPDVNIRFRWKVYQKDDARIAADSIDWKLGVGKEIKTEKGYRIDVVNKLIAPELKSLEEAKGYYTNDYQNYLEKEWLQSLRRTHSVTVNTELLKTIK